MPELKIAKVYLLSESNEGFENHSFCSYDTYLNQVLLFIMLKLFREF